MSITPVAPNCICGKLVQVGTDPATGMTRALVSCTVEQLRAIEYLPIYHDVVVITRKEYEEMKDRLDPSRKITKAFLSGREHLEP